MQLKKILAKDMRHALLQVREELGDDAAILSTRSLATGGVEVIATLSPAPVVNKGPVPGDTPPPSASKAEIGAMRNELHSIRTLLQQRLNGLAWEQFSSHSPLQAVVWERLSAMGVPGFLSRRLLATVKPGKTLDQVWKQVLGSLVKALPVLGHDPIEQGGVFAFLGPTGAGKTTTIAKLATRYVLQHGPQDVALVTTDSFRLAAHEQLRTLGRILGVSVRIVENQQSLDETLDSLGHKKLVLIDTAGLPSHHPEQQRQLTLLRDQPQVRKWLVLPTTSQAQVLRAAWKTCSTAEVSACILTHLDEACVLGDALALTIERNLPVVYETFGQAIPDDIAQAQAQVLVKRAVALGRRQASVPVEKERLMTEYGSQSPEELRVAGLN
ncbi:flagellar biosynthesis protein FlhF [Pseudohongiella sp.]|uniref:Flagellar biosynthesis protein FlhF n=1 Tax=marine sediment metagenome TaxID=412755 RepID=A0A0F9Z0U9_9ZZZZ|nr:flagellar biosynthesis protein FlhF [Pseudohongiella sp.]HDZ09934.1 flagellar biosynthesis protein FlhF [Pseudohongiella sp.]HEA63680.1 flagellar biosynthesis protein FlhF [Pseudohongiella sp.]